MQKDENTVTNELSMTDFWKELWEWEASYNPLAKQIEKSTCEWSDVINQSEVQIMEKEVQRRLRKLPNWKAPGKRTESLIIT